MNAPERLLTAREVGELLGVSTAWVLRQSREGIIPSLRLAGQVRPVRYRWSQVEAALVSTAADKGGSVSATVDNTWEVE